MSDIERFFVNCSENVFFGTVDVFVFCDRIYKNQQPQLLNLPKS